MKFIINPKTESFNYFHVDNDMPITVKNGIYKEAQKGCGRMKINY
jgi:hypothetical protein